MGSWFSPVSAVAPRSCHHTCPAASLPWAVNSPGFNVNRLSVCCAVPGFAAVLRVEGSSPGAYWPVSASSPEGTSTASTGAALLRSCASQCASTVPRAEPDGVCLVDDRTPMPSRASMHRSCSVRSVGGVSAHTMFVQCRAFSQDWRASGGNVSVVPSQLMTTLRPARAKWCAASSPSPPLLPGPQAIQIVRACGAMACASCATARPARCIKVCGANWAAMACSRRRVASVLNRG